MDVKALRGTKDVLPDEVAAWQRIEEISRRLFSIYGYREIRTPSIEEASLFERTIGETTDIVQKEMYTFTDRGERRISLRPEATAPVVRAYLEHGLHKKEGFVKLYYIGPMFRSERPQAGRMRQFHHIGVEAIGSDSPYLDAEVILLMTELLKEIGIAGFSIKLNSLGCVDDRKRLGTMLKKELKKEEDLLCTDCKERVKRNVYRVFDCKNDSCRRIAVKLPTTLDHLCSACKEHFEKVKAALDSLGISFEVAPHLVRGLDYYTRTAFEVVHPNLGAQDAIGAGGRYDDLVKELGGPHLGAIGFAMGFERLLMALGAVKEELQVPSKLDLYIVTIGNEPYKRAFEFITKARQNGISAEIDYGQKSVKAQMREADKLGAKFTVVLGDDELKKGSAKLREMASGREEEIRVEKLVESIKKRLNYK